MIGATLARNVFDGKNLGEFSVTFANSIKIPENIEEVSVKAMLFGDLENITPLHMIEQ